METTKTFQELGVSEEILRALEKKGVGLPTRVQEEAIPPLLAWKDVIAKAPTGTGKTFAFGIPMIEHIEPASDDLQGLILAPTSFSVATCLSPMAYLCSSMARTTTFLLIPVSLSTGHTEASTSACSEASSRAENCMQQRTTSVSLSPPPLVMRMLNVRLSAVS